MSAFPAELHGIHWMDQRGTSLRNGPYPEAPDYKQVCGVAAEEVFLSFGEAAWDAASKCVTGVRREVFLEVLRRGFWMLLRRFRPFLEGFRRDFA